MEKDNVIKAFAQLGKLMSHIATKQKWENFDCGITENEYENLQRIINKQFVLNGWFTKENVYQSLNALGSQLTESNLNEWTNDYSFSISPKNIAIIMAGNIPLVGFHDFMSVLISGHNAICKLSSDDNSLLPALAQHLIQFSPELKQRIIFTNGKMNKMDAIIATGSDNSIRHFKEYFGHLPNIFRKNRTSIAVLTGTETRDELALLGKDIFEYFGLGCRNVSHLIVPENYNFNLFFESIVDFHPIINHHKYANNYDYNKAVYLLNKSNLLDNNFVLLKKSNELFSPLAMINYHYYKNEEELNQYLEYHNEQIQIIVGKNYTAFGNAQRPLLTDYADGINTLNWLQKL
ncbi:MAG: acyl-CoA reductase [Crocinitomicaceae bacterium]